MNARIFIIALALAAPIVTIAFMTKQAEVLPKPPENPVNNAPQAKATPAPARAARRPNPPASLEEAKDRLRQKLSDLESMTAEEWADAKKRRSGGVSATQPTSLEEAKDRVRQRLSELEKMTPEEWAAEQMQKMDEAVSAAQARQQSKWNSLTPEQKMNALTTQPQNPQGAVERAPEVEMPKAKPQADFPAAKAP